MIILGFCFLSAKLCYPNVTSGSSRAVSVAVESSSPMLNRFKIFYVGNVRKLAA